MHKSPHPPPHSPATLVGALPLKGDLYHSVMAPKCLLPPLSAHPAWMGTEGELQSGVSGRSQVLFGRFRPLL